MKEPNKVTNNRLYDEFYLFFGVWLRIENLGPIGVEALDRSCQEHREIRNKP